MKLTWYGHSCFAVESKGYRVVLDPYADGSVDGLEPLRLEADLVLCSHEHGDHNARSAVSLRKGGRSPFEITDLTSWHDDRQGKLRGKNTIRLLDDGECRVAHLGDLGCEPTAEQMELLRGLDAIMIPVGGHFTIDATQAKGLAEKLKAKAVIPMHYRSAGVGFAVLGTLEDYTKLCGDVIFYEKNEIEITKAMKEQTAVLRLPKQGA